MRNIENSLLRPHADPIIKKVICEACDGAGMIETFECSDSDCKKENECLGCLETMKVCGDCDGEGKVEIWR